MSDKPQNTPVEKNAETAAADGAGVQVWKPEAAESRPQEIGGRGGLDPTRYGDWEKNGRCIDF